MSFDKVENVFYFNDYRSFFKFITNWDGDLVIKKWEVYSEDKLVGVFNHKERIAKKVDE